VTMQAITASNTLAAPKVAVRSLSARRTVKALAPRPVAPKRRGISLVVQAKETLDQTTGYIGKDNSGNGNLFAIEPKQLYTESPTSDKYAKVGLGGIPGVILACGILAGVYFATTTLGSFEETNQEFVNYQGQSLSYYIDLFQ